MARNYTLPDGRAVVLDGSRLTVRKDAEIESIVNPKAGTQIKDTAITEALARWDKKPTEQELLEVFTRWYGEIEPHVQTEDKEREQTLRRIRLRIAAITTVDGVPLTEDGIDDLPAFGWDAIQREAREEFNSFFPETSTS